MTILILLIVLEGRRKRAWDHRVRYFITRLKEISLAGYMDKENIF